MPNSFDITIKDIKGRDFTLELQSGEVYFVLGANGTGKSSLISRWFSHHSEIAKKISAHRQTWFTTNTLNITSSKRSDLEMGIRTRDLRTYSRYLQDYAEERAGIAIFDLIDAETMLSLEIADLVRTERLDDATNKAQQPSPIQEINELMRLSNMFIELRARTWPANYGIPEKRKSYNIAELSDGERNAFSHCR